MNIKKLLLSAVVSTLAFTSLTACDDKSATSKEDSSVPKVIKVGVVPGPYREILDTYLNPIVKKKGHELKFVEFTDWVQPDSSLESGDIDANLFQHQLYLEGIVKNQGLHLSSVVNFPTLGIYVFSDKFNSLDSIEKGSLVGIPNDPVNLARALRVARDLKLITLNAEKDDQKASLADIEKNPKQLNFVVMEAAQLTRSLDSVAVAFVPGNYAYAAKLDLAKAIGKESVAEPIKLVIAVQNHRVNGVGKFLRDAVLDPEFKKGVDSDPVFKNFAMPKWWNE